MDTKDKIKNALDKCKICKGEMYYQLLDGAVVVCPRCDALNLALRIVGVAKNRQKSTDNNNNPCVQ